MTYLALKFEILKKFPSQADFALALNERESKVSRVLHNRQMLTPEESKVWQRHLNCERSVLETVTQSD